MNFDLINSLNDFDNVILPYGNLKYNLIEKLYKCSNINDMIYKNIDNLDTLTTSLAIVVLHPIELIPFQKIDNIQPIGIIYKKNNKLIYKGPYVSFEWDKPLPEMGEEIRLHPRLGNVCILTLGLQNIHMLANLLYVAYNSGNVLLLAYKKWHQIKNVRDKYIQLITSKYKMINYKVIDTIFKSWIAYNIKVSCEHFSTNNINPVSSIIEKLYLNPINYNMCVENIKNMELFEIYFKLWYPHNSFHKICKNELSSNTKLYDKIAEFMIKLNR